MAGSLVVSYLKDVPEYAGTFDDGNLLPIADPITGEVRTYVILAGERPAFLFMYSPPLSERPAEGREGVLYVDVSAAKWKMFLWDSTSDTYITVGGGGSGAEFETGFIVNLPNNTTGVPNGYQVNAGDKIDAFIEQMMRKAAPPTYTAPTASLPYNPANITREVGETIMVTVNSTFTQNDAGSSTGLSVSKNGSVVASAIPYTDTIVLTKAGDVYKVTYAYAQGACKADSLGVIDCTGRIQAGSVNSGNISYAGVYKIFFDAAPPPSTAAQIRAAANSRFENAGNVFNLNTGSTSTTFWFWLPNSKNLVSVVDLDALNAVITADYIVTNVSTTDAAGNTVAGKLYVKTNGVAYTENHRHQITIS